MKTKIVIAILLCIAIILRFYNLDHTARFTRDESSDLVAIKNIYVHHKITLVGPMDEGGIEVFSSLTYYLFLPFAVIFNFDPISTAYAAAFYGSLTLILLALVLKKNHWSYLTFSLAIIFTPLLVASRWAWNPYLIPLWQVFALLILFSNLPFKYLLVGLLMGLTIHQHWYAVFTVAALGLIILILYKKFKFVLGYSLGVVFSLIPFLLFDLRHPPGLFFSRMIYFSPLASSHQPVPYLFNFYHNTLGIFSHFSGSQQFFGIITLIFTLLIIVFHRTKNNLWLLPLLFQVVGVSLTHSSYQDHYLIPAGIFYLFWLHQNQKNNLTKFLTILLIIFNLINVFRLLSFTDWTSNIQAQIQITNFIAQYQQHDPSFNVVVLQSPDNTTKGLRFKDQLALRNVFTQDTTEYQKIDTIYIISYQHNWQKLVADQAYELTNFRHPKPDSIQPISGSDWIVYKVNNGDKITNGR